METIENCRVLKNAISRCIGYPDLIDGKCQGYCTEESDDPCEQCKRCRYLQNWEAANA
ncbi:hypothetical protein SPSIL_008820 [Sporomusa silvacetica DSM 10669]|uniref:Uncharacterized protein n=1 Tax=Sporomusa silvacetica DSM 10669 TaxID=1123289 RepID=A0ABZ3IHB8_9FIRM|nr:hypothetical protein [Sporomusa silvacetica]OZC13158.1 hypothetical protein SPSIL_56140 [Sporomusa silvacetica DSM 10669]